MRSNARPSLAVDFHPAIDHLIRIDPDADTPARFAVYSAAVTEFEVLDSAFVPVGQTDTEVRDELRQAVAMKAVRPIAAVVARVIARKRAVDEEWPGALGWKLLDVVDLADEAAEHTDFSELQRHWLRIATYAALVAYAPAGTPLPQVPVRKAHAWHPTIDLGLVPGDRPLRRCAAEDDDTGHLPVTLRVRR